VFLENVSGHLRRGFSRVLSDLRSMDYTVTAGLFSAEEVGATQHRERLFILAHSDRTERSVRGSVRRDHEEECASSERGSDALAGAPGQRRGEGRTESAGKLGRQHATERRKQVAQQLGNNRQRPRCRELGSQRQKQGGVTRQAGTQLARFPLFPPGPNSLDDWERVLRAEVGLAPALPKEAECRFRSLAHGLARVDALRLYGNGVVPLQAAYAFSTLVAAATKVRNAYVGKAY
jgi:DNA (cytosine-5)-methyltransferase 1